QAMRGKESYDKSCASCHGQDLGGRDPAPPLVGEIFSDHWIGRNANDLYSRVHSTMPLGKPGSLDDRTYLEILAYMLQANTVMAGKDALVNDPSLLQKMKLVKQ